MPFGSGDREVLRQISSQLTQAVTELAALKQQVADQQQAIDQIRQDATASVTTGLAEIRAVARDGLSRTSEIVTGPLASIGNELVAIRGAVGQLDSQLRTAAAAAPPAAQEREPDSAPEPAPIENQMPEPQPETPAVETEPQQPSEEDLAILRAAAGISAATLHAHRDTWEFLVKHAGQDRHFHLPATATAKEGAIAVAVSGPTLVATLTSLATVSRSAADPGTRAIAGHLHARLTETVEEIITRPHRGDGAAAVKIVIDDRAKPADQDD